MRTDKQADITKLQQSLFAKFANRPIMNTKLINIASIWAIKWKTTKVKINVIPGRTCIKILTTKYKTHRHILK